MTGCRFHHIGQAWKLTFGELCIARDSLGRELLRQALEQDKLVLGIRQSISLLNVRLSRIYCQDSLIEHSGMAPLYDRAVHHL